MLLWLPHWNQEQNELNWSLKITKPHWNKTMHQDHESWVSVKWLVEDHIFLSFTQDDGGGGPGGGGGGGGGGAPIRGGGAWNT